MLLLNRSDKDDVLIRLCVMLMRQHVAGLCLASPCISVLCHLVCHYWQGLCLVSPLHHLYVALMSPHTSVVAELVCQVTS
jgi:hypothetical protein